MRNITSLFHPVGWTKSGTFSTPRGQKSFCAGFFPSSGVENVPDFVHPVGETVNVTVKSMVKSTTTHEFFLTFAATWPSVIRSLDIWLWQFA